MKLKIVLLALWLCVPHYASAQAPKYPVKPIRMIVGYAPGGGNDIMGRLMAQQITEATGQQVIVENRAGAAQNIAAELVARSPNDGYTLFLSSAALAVNVTLYPKLNYDPVKDFAPVAVFHRAPISCWSIHRSRPGVCPNSSQWQERIPASSISPRREAAALSISPARCSSSSSASA
jgi:tripartite-type tricarboxylate transporter receptor subunit TctC